MKYKNESGEWINGPKGDKGDKGDAGETPDIHELDEYVSERVFQDVSVVTVEENRIPNPLMPTAGTTEGWGLGSPTQNEYPVWTGERARWVPSSIGTTTLTPTIPIPESRQITVSATVAAQAGTRGRFQVHYGTTVNSTTMIGTAHTSIDSEEPERLSINVEAPEGETVFRVAFCVLTAVGWIEFGEVTTASHAFDGDSLAEDPLMSYSWSGEPLASWSLLKRGALNRAVLSDKVNSIETIDTVPANNPDKYGTLYIVPATRAPIFTDFERGVLETTVRGDTTVAWESTTSAVSRQAKSGHVGRSMFSLNAANTATDVEVLTLSDITYAGNEYSGNQFGPVVRGGTIYQGITLMTYYVASTGLICRIQELGTNLTNLGPEVEVAPGHKAGTKYWQRLRVDGDMVFGKIWEEGTIEPVDWQLTGQTQNTLGSGWVGVRASSPAQTNFYRMGVSFNNQKAPGSF